MNSAFRISQQLKFSGFSGENRSSGAAVAIGGVALAVMVMVMTLAIVSGFKSEITRKVMGFDAQITIDRPYNYSDGSQLDRIALNDNLTEIISFGQHERPMVTLEMRLPGILKTDNDFWGAVFTAFDGKHNFSFETENLIEGQFPNYNLEESSNDIVVSRLAASKLGLSVGDRPFVYFFVDGNLKTRRLKVAGIFESNMTEYDKTIVYASLSLLQGVAGLGANEGTRLGISGYETDQIAETALMIQNNLNNAVQRGELDQYYPVGTVLQTGAIYFNWLSLLDTNVAVIFILMLCVGMFTLVSSLYLIILDRIPTIGLLKALGASRRWLCTLFVGIGMRIAVKGIIIGNVLGLGLCCLQKYTGLVRLDPSMYYLDRVPVGISWWAVIILNLGVLAASWMILYVPACSAASIDPTESLRRE